MTDLTKIDKPFGLLDEATQEALDQARKDGKPMQVLQERGWEMRMANGPFGKYLTYRVKPEPVVTKFKAYAPCVVLNDPPETSFGTYINRPMYPGTITTTLDEDGRPVRAVWEADE